MKPPCKFIAVPKVVLARSDMTQTAKLLLGAIISGAHKNGKYRVKAATLAVALGVTRRYILASNDRLEELGFIGVQHTGKASIYTILDLNPSSPQRDEPQFTSEVNPSSDQSGTAVHVDLIRTSYKSSLQEGAAQECPKCFDSGTRKTKTGLVRCSCPVGQAVTDQQLATKAMAMPPPSMNRPEGGSPNMTLAEMDRRNKTTREEITRAREKASAA
jgi:hypothetical protein